MKKRAEILWTVRLPEPYLKFLYECYPGRTLREVIHFFLIERKRRIVPLGARGRVLHGKVGRHSLRLDKEDWERIELLMTEFRQNTPSEGLKAAIRQKAERAGYLLEIERSRSIW